MLRLALLSVACLWLRPLSFFSQCAPHMPLLLLWGCGVGRLLTICALISLPWASWSGGAYQGFTPVRWVFRSPRVRGVGVAAGALSAGPGGCLTILGPSYPLTTTTPTSNPAAAFFTTSGYRTLHEFRS
ncbi:hypothetical protein HJG60_008251 [Phyllostomus discolor]|uniref:Uncharacterized protein n=1 Tax=Phyllostomus discolor TaxID=89673 RepID=A0A833ZCF3_9CHIR|nr:hypothetical protein HJG60_008251 [Phyllostomus discolor]